MSTVGAVVDRVYREYLRPAGDYPLHAPLETTINNSETGVVYTTGYLQSEDEGLLAPGVLFEIDAEIFEIQSVVTATRTMTVVTRPREGTTAAAHTAGANIYFAQDYPRQEVIDAVCDEVAMLYPDLWQVATVVAVMKNGYEAPATAMEALGFRYKAAATGLWTQVPVELVDDITESSSTKLLQFPMGDSPSTHGYLTYKGRFTRPTAETDDLTASGGTWALRPEWEKVLVIGAAASILLGADIEKASAEFLTEALESQAFPPRSGEAVHRMLRRYRDELVTQLNRQLRASSPAPVMEISGMMAVPTL